MRESQHIALFGDISKSRSLERSVRFNVQQQFQEVVTDLNTWLGSDGLHVEPLEIWAGDAIKGLVPDARLLIHIVTRISDALRPARMVFGAGVGPLSTDDAAPVSEIDGPCIHRAKQALAEARKRDSWLEVRGLSQQNDLAVSGIYSLLDTIRSDWSDLQAATVKEARKHAYQKDVAKALNRARSTISERLKSAKYDALRRGEEAASIVLYSFLQELGRDE